MKPEWFSSLFFYRELKFRQNFAWKQFVRSTIECSQCHNDIGYVIQNKSYYGHLPPLLVTKNHSTFRADSILSATSGKNSLHYNKH